MDLSTTEDDTLVIEKSSYKRSYSINFTREQTAKLTSPWTQALIIKITGRTLKPHTSDPDVLISLWKLKA